MLICFVTTQINRHLNDFNFLICDDLGNDIKDKRQVLREDFNYSLMKLIRKQILISQNKVLEENKEI